jgi:RNA polymerase sigma factor (TIGR02999 family)
VNATDLSPSITHLLHAARDGDAGARERLFALIYPELRRIARQAFGGERPGHLLQPTALVHEAYLRLVDQRRMTWRDRLHFYDAAALTMRRLLVEHARAGRAAKRGGGRPALSLALPGVGLVAAAAGEEQPGSDPHLAILALDDALTRLAALDERQAAVAQLRVFGGLTVREVAVLVGVAEATVERDWRLARAWLGRRLRGAGDGQEMDADGA